MNRFLSKGTSVIVAVFLLAMLAGSVLADGGGHLWFYSVDPDSLTWADPNVLPNPQDVDPNYIASDPDPWLDQGIVISSSDWAAGFSIWLGCAQFESIDTIVVVSINNAAYAAIDSIMVNGIPITMWTDGTPSALAPHGVFNSAEFKGYAEIPVGNLYSPPGTPYAVEIPVDITLKEAANISEAKIHFDAYGYTESGCLMFSPYSHDLTFHVSEAAPILAVTSLIAFGFYVYRRKKTINSS